MASARLDERVRREVLTWPDGTVVTLRIAPFGPQVSWRVFGGVLEHLGGGQASSDLLVTFKSVDDALPLLLGMQGILAAFEEHRATVRGDLAVAMSLVRCLHIVEGYLFPDIMTKRILPHPAERRVGHLRAYGALVHRTAALEGASSAGLTAFFQDLMEVVSSTGCCLFTTLGILPGALVEHPERGIGVPDAKLLERLGISLK